MIQKRRTSLLFIIIALAWSYAFWIPAAIVSAGNPEWPWKAVFNVLGGIGPLAAALVCVTKERLWGGFLKSTVSVRFPKSWVWVLIVSPLFVSALSSLIGFGRIEISEEFLSAGIFYFVFLLFFGPVPEEVGWRGILFDGLSRTSVLRAQVITAGVWLVWHLPLFFVSGTYQNGVGFASMGFFMWCMLLIVQSLIMGRLYLLSGRSILSAILFHYLVNLSGEMIYKDINSQIISLVLYLVIFTIILIKGKR